MGLQRQGEIFIKTALELTENRRVLTLEPYLFIAISWSAVPEQPLDVTANGFPQGTTKKRMGSLQARSRISKVELFRSFQKLLSSISEDKWPDSLRVQKLETYQEYKEAAAAYQEAWSTLRKHAFGSWIRNPPDYHQFK
ncbi:hypothetical protein HJG60_009263 [Phyllostomus discolor]|uniref:tRNA-specific adenosine deaminase 1 n=1 Tax=Phyllostomus discolor TaxID=89673 RepID=A0A833YQQ6_9CHIR|nr:hypothetical protein HJG60_009263 [Phyllostomus discolor]